MASLLRNLISLYDAQDSFSKRLTFKLVYLKIRWSIQCSKHKEKNIWQIKYLLLLITLLNFNLSPSWHYNVIICLSRYKFSSSKTVQSYLYLNRLIHPWS